jgi:DNA-binding transcriptional LysR family regulator
MDVDQLSSFAEVARRGNLSRAAETLRVTQPALTARLQRLEGELGTPLFVRTGRGMRLAESGRAFLPHAERALSELEDGRRVVTELQRGSVGHLAIGAAPAVSTYVLPSLLKSFADRHPNVQLSVRTGHSEEVLELVLRDQVQLGLVRAIRHPDVKTTPLYEDHLVLVVHPSHPFAERGVIATEDLAEAQLILFDRTSSYHQLTSAFFREAGVTPRGVLELDNIDATKKMVRQGLGVALLPQTAVVDELADGSLSAVRIRDGEPVRRQIVAIQRRDAGPATAPVSDFMELLEAIAAPAAAA